MLILLLTFTLLLQVIGSTELKKYIFFNNLKYYLFLDENLHNQRIKKIIKQSPLNSTIFSMLVQCPSPFSMHKYFISSPAILHFSWHSKSPHPQVTDSCRRGMRGPYAV